MKETGPEGAADVPQKPVVISDELRAKILAGMEANKRLGPSVIPEDATWEYRALPGEAVIACCTHDTVGRRVTCFASLDVSVSLDGVKLAQTIVRALNGNSQGANNENRRTRPPS